MSVIISFGFGVIFGFVITSCLAASKISESYLEGYNACERKYKDNKKNILLGENNTGL